MRLRNPRRARLPQRIKADVRTDNMKYEWTAQRIGIGVWAAVLAAVLVVAAYPIGLGVLRLFVAVAVPLLWSSAVFLMRRRTSVAIGVAVAGLLVLGFAVLPGMPPNPTRLRRAYVEELRHYEGSRYVWGGENRRGIDCSGLVRRALINAHIQLALTTFNPKSLRIALDLWWHDCSALALGQQYRGFTKDVITVSSANAAQESALQPGDIGVTVGGVHVLAYLGNQQWIEADPGLLKVVILRIPSQNGWMNQPLNIMRWRMMTESANQQMQPIAGKPGSG